MSLLVLFFSAGPRHIVPPISPTVPFGAAVCPAPLPALKISRTDRHWVALAYVGLLFWNGNTYGAMAMPTAAHIPKEGATPRSVNNVLTTSFYVFFFFFLRAAQCCGILMRLKRAQGGCCSDCFLASIFVPVWLI